MRRKNQTHTAINNDTETINKKLTHKNMHQNCKRQNILIMTHCNRTLTKRKERKKNKFQTNKHATTNLTFH